MSYSIYYDIRANKKTSYFVDTLFFGKKLVYDFKRVKDTPIFDSYVDAREFINDHQLEKVHVRKITSTSGGSYVKDYIDRRNIDYGD